jgi:hypothetical protein
VAISIEIEPTETQKKIKSINEEEKIEKSSERGFAEKIV